jgi:trans-2,3-dihydro-3-hydroxyanthranilate isomerase
VFSARRLAGNQLAVVHDADDLDDETMQRFARETRLSETTFVQRASADGADYRNRIWMMRGELPFAGHPSLGTAVAVAVERGQERARYVQQTGAGLQPVDVEVRGDGVARASMLQEPARFGDAIDPAQVAATAGLRPEDLDQALAPQIVSCGVAQLIAPVRAGALDKVRPDPPSLTALLDAHGTVCIYLAECGEQARARSFFVDPDGVTEDPATGSAAGPLMAYLHEHAGAERVVIDQGVEMGRPSRLECEVAGDRVRVAGDCVVVATGTVRL